MADVTTIDELAAQVAELTAIVGSLQRTMNPVDASGLPVPTNHETNTGSRGMDGPRWQVGPNWTVLALDDDGEPHVYLRDHYGQNTGDISSATLAEAIQLAGGLLAAVRYKAARLASGDGTVRSVQDFSADRNGLPISVDSGQAER